MMQDIVAQVSDHPKCTMENSIDTWRYFEKSVQHRWLLCMYSMLIYEVRRCMIWIAPKLFSTKLSKQLSFRNTNLSIHLVRE